MASQWFYQRDGIENGPVSSPELTQLAASGKLKPVDLIWKEGMSEWVPASRLTKLFPTVARASSLSPPPLPNTSEPPPVPPPRSLPPPVPPSPAQFNSQPTFRRPPNKGLTGKHVAIIVVVAVLFIGALVRLVGFVDNSGLSGRGVASDGNGDGSPSPSEVSKQPQSADGSNTSTDQPNVPAQARAQSSADQPFITETAGNGTDTIVVPGDDESITADYYPFTPWSKRSRTRDVILPPNYLCPKMRYLENIFYRPDGTIETVVIKEGTITDGGIEWKDTTDIEPNETGSDDRYLHQNGYIEIEASGNWACYRVLKLNAKVGDEWEDEPIKDTVRSYKVKAFVTYRGRQCAVIVATMVLGLPILQAASRVDQ
jgi:hypothetical protein